LSYRFAHLYAEWPALYSGFYALTKRGLALWQCREIKNAASDALIAADDATTPYNAVRHDQRRWWDAQCPESITRGEYAARSERSNIEYRRASGPATSQGSLRRSRHDYCTS
jgi:alkyldihydroxyacetonephosphate synthase